MRNRDDTNCRRAGEREYLFDMLAQLSKLASGCGEELIARVLMALATSPEPPPRALTASMVSDSLSGATD